VHLFNDAAIRTFVIQVVAPLILIFIGIGILARSRKANYGEVMNTAVIAFIGIVFIVGAVALMAAGGRVASALFGG
jgi:hypothetical protein